MTTIKIKTGILLRTALALLLAAMLGACSNAGQSQSPPVKAISMAWPRDVGPLNPHLYTPSEMFAQSMVYDSLVSYGANGEIEPALAESWEVSDDGLTYTFHLRQGVRYSDGSAFDADNAVRNFEAIMANRNRHSWMGLVRHIGEVKKVDEYTIRLRLTDYYYPVLQDLSFVRPFRFLGDAGFPEDGKTSETIAGPIGTGPWKVKEYKKDEYAIFEQNEHYWGEKPRLEQITVKIIPDPESIVLAFEKGDIDLIYGQGVISRDSFQYLKDSGKYGVALSEGLSTRGIIMNTQMDGTSELAVRRAIQYGIDKDALLQNITKGTELKADTALGRNVPYADLDLKPIDYDPDKARQLLDEAGWKLEPGSGIRMKHGRPLKLKFVYIETEAVQKQMAEVIQGDLGKIGIKLDIQGAEVMLGLQMLRNGEANMNFWSSYGTPNDPHNFATVIATPTMDGLYEAFSGLPEKAEMDGIVQKALISKNDEERSRLYAELLSRIHEQAVIYPISYEANAAVYQPRLTGVAPTASKYRFPLETIDVAP